MKLPLIALPLGAALLLGACAETPPPAAPGPVSRATPAGSPAAPAPAMYPKVTFPAASPACTLIQRVGLTDITVKYSRPGVKGRVVFGGLIPYGYVWRTGANTSTKLTFSTDVKIEGHDVPAGTYALYTIPGADSWTIILDKDTKLWGAYDYDPKNDFLRFDVTPVALGSSIETFTIDFTNIRDDAADLDLLWDRTLVKFHLETDVVGPVGKQIDAALAASASQSFGFYLNAGTFYLNHGPDLDRALDLANHAVELATPEKSSSHRMLFEAQFLKAKVLLARGDKAGAAEMAHASREGALKNDGANSGFLRMNDDILAQARE